MTGSHAPNGLRNEPEVKMAWAQYISYFISAYKALGVDIWAGEDTHSSYASQDVSEKQSF